MKNMRNKFEYGNFVVHIIKYGRELVMKALISKVDQKCLVHSGRGEKIEESKVLDSMEIRYKKMWEEERYKKAYNEIKSKPGNMTPGVDGETLDRFSNVWIKETIEKLKNRTYQFKPSKRIMIPKKNGKVRPLGIPTPKDKIIQRVLLNIMEPEYEKEFLKTSHGFRPKKGCITALREVEKWTGVTWMIEGDIKGYFDNIDHHKLAEILRKKIKDKNIIDLYWKLVKAGYIETDGKLLPNELGVPQGGVLSPLLSNIYLHELDLFMEKIKKEYKTEMISKQSPEYNKAITPYRNAVKAYKEKKNSETLKTLKEKRKILLNTKYTLRTGTNVHYVRYADDFLVGIIGTRKVAEEIKSKIKEFMTKELMIELNEEKTKITNINKKPVKFLGYLISGTDRKYYESSIQKVNGLIRRSNYGRIKLYIPVVSISERLIEKGFVRKTGFKAKYYGPWINLEEQEIVMRFRSIIMGYKNYYKWATDYNNIKNIVYLLKYSAIHTLAAKYKTSIAKIIAKYGKNVEIKIGKKTLNLDYVPKIEKTIVNTEIRDPLETTNYLLRTKYKGDEPCRICGATNNIEMHHIRHLKDLNPKLSAADSMMAKMKRKQIPVCQSCHDLIHGGKYSGKKLG